MSNNNEVVGLTYHGRPTPPVFYLDTYTHNPPDVVLLPYTGIPPLTAGKLGIGVSGYDSSRSAVY
jgi:hypothetical protein